MSICKRKAIVFVAMLVAIVCALVACGKNEEPVRLPAPQNIRAEGMYLVWDSVPNATGYVVFVENTEYHTSECRYDMSFLANESSYDVEVTASGDGKRYSDSQAGSYKFVTYGPKERGYGKNGVLYTLMSDGTGYEASRGLYQDAELLEIDDYYNGLPVKRIADDAFYHTRKVLMSFSYSTIEMNCNKIIKSVKLPARLEHIGLCAFAYFTRVQTLVIPDSVITIDIAAFKGWGSLSSLKLSKSLKIIGDEAFSGSVLESIELPNGLEQIGSIAFSSARDLINFVVADIDKRLFGDVTIEKIYSEKSGTTIFATRLQPYTKVVIPDSVKVLGAGAFGYGNLADITFPQNLEACENAFNETPWFKSQQGPVIGGGIVWGYNGDADEPFKVVLPQGVKAIAGRAFGYMNSKIAEIYIPDGVKFMNSVGIVGIGSRFSNIGAPMTFASCKFLTKVRLPADIKEIPSGTFAYCDNLVDIE